MILVFAVIFTFKIHEHFFKILRLHKLFDDLSPPTELLCAEGRDIINQVSFSQVFNSFQGKIVGGTQNSKIRRANQRRH